jgi:N-acetylmuramoyl-L-alanine amidase
VNRRLALAILLGCSLAGLASCDKKKAVPKDAPLSISLDEAFSPESAPRAEIVAKADALALRAHKKKGKEASRLLSEAAELRETSYRRHGKEVDALEALELWSDAADASPEDQCQLGLRLVSLRGILNHDPAEQFREYYLLKERHRDAACQQRTSRALAALAHYEPGPDILREWRKNAKVESDVAASTPVSHESPADVVVPEILRASLDNPTKITKVEPFGAERTARVVVHVTHPTKFKVGVLERTSERGPRLFVDIQHASYAGEATLTSTGLVERVRLGEQEDSTRLVLDLREEVYHRVFYLPEPFRLVIDLSLEPPDEKASPRQIQRVVLDPGHGGHDPGAVGPNGLREKDVALDIAHRAAPLLAREVGVSTLLTRDVDAFVPLDERAARANAFHADLFISIHLNSSEDQTSRGVMTFVLDTSRDAAASKIAARENASTEAAAAELATSLSRIESADRRAASETFAQLLQRAAGASLRQKYDEVEDQGVRRAGFYVLAGASMPAVLFEGSFISNPVESRRLNSEDYRQRLADAVVNAVRAYREGL